MRFRRSIFYSALMLTGVNLLLRTAATSFQVYLSGRIGASGIGLMQLVLSVTGMAMTASIAGIRTGAMYLTAEELGKGKPGNVIWVLSDSFLYSILCSTAVGAMVYLFAPQIATFWIGHPEACSALRLFAAFLPVSCLCGVMTGYFTAANRIGTLAAVEVAEQLCSMVVTVLALQLWAGNNPSKACQAVILGGCAGSGMTLLCLLLLRLLEKTKTNPRIPMCARLMNTAVPLALADDLRAGISTIENLMVPKRLSLYQGVTDPLALFGTVCGMVFPILMFPCAILFGLTELLIPEMARCNAAGSTARIRYLMERSLKIVFLYGTICGCIQFLIADPLCQALYHNTLAGQHLRWFSLLTVMLYTDIVTDAIIKGLGQQKASVRYNILTSAMDVAFLFVLLPHYGMAGYFVSFAVTHAINFGLSIRRLIKITGHPLSLFTGISVLICAILAVFAASFLTVPLAQVLAFLAIFTSLLYLMKVISIEDLLWLRSLLKIK